MCVYLDSSPGEDFVLLEDAIEVVFVGDFEDGDSLDLGHFGGLLYSRDASYESTEV